MVRGMKRVCPLLFIVRQRGLGSHTGAGGRGLDCRMITAAAHNAPSLGVRLADHIQSYLSSAAPMLTAKLTRSIAAA